VLVEQHCPKGIVKATKARVENASKKVSVFMEENGLNSNQLGYLERQHMTLTAARDPQTSRNSTTNGSNRKSMQGNRCNASIGRLAIS
jgi:hypothetical protein